MLVLKGCGQYNNRFKVGSLSICTCTYVLICIGVGSFVKVEVLIVVTLCAQSARKNF